MFFWVFQRFFVFSRVSMFFYVFSMFFLHFSPFRQYPSSGSFRGRVWGPQCIFFVYSRTTIWALFAKQQGHQIASIVTTCTRTDEEPCIRGPLCSCTDTDLFGSKSLRNSANCRGSPAQNPYCCIADLADTESCRNLADGGDDANSRSDPTFTRAHPGLPS